MELKSVATVQYCPWSVGGMESTTCVTRREMAGSVAGVVAMIHEG